MRAKRRTASRPTTLVPSCVNSSKLRRACAAQAAPRRSGYSAVTDFVRAWRQGEGQAVNVTAFVPLNFELGEAFQFDWSEEGLVVGGIYYRMQVSHLNLTVNDATPAYTTFVLSTTGTTPATPTACRKATPANPAPAATVACDTAHAAGTSGSVSWIFSGR
ncbi:hypothetical protein ABIC89_002641 [Variovorax boronicumulans]